MVRKPIPKRVRFEVFKRDGFRCTYCGQRPPEVVLVVDHVVPVADGGGDEAENLTTACFTCNSGKGAIPLGRVMPSIDEEAMIEAMQEVAERRMAMEGFYAEQRAYQEDVNAIVDQVQALWHRLAERANQDTAGDREFVRYVKEEFERRSIVNFIRRGLGPREFENAIQIVAESWSNGPRSAVSLWKHFCKLCWDAIRASGVDW